MALRIVSPDIVHKFEVKGVALDLRDVQQVRQAYRDMLRHVGRAMPDARVVGVMARGMIPAGHEVILGAKRDAVFGPTVMFGLGGLFVEILKDVTFALAPIALATAGRMVREIKSYRMLEGARGLPAADTESIQNCLCRLSRLVVDWPRIVELDINPLIVHPVGKGCQVADVRIRLAGPPAGQEH